MNEDQAETVNRITKTDILTMVMDFAAGRTTASDLMDKIAERCNASFSLGQHIPIV